MRFSDKTTRRLAVLGAVSALAVGALALPALAQTATEETPDTSSEPVPSPDARFEGRQSEFAEALAEELGLPVDRVTDAITAAREKLAEQWQDERAAELRERLDEAVADGQLTQEQADAIVAATEAGVLRGGHQFDEHPRMFGHRGGMNGLPERPGAPDDAPSEDTGA